MTLRILHDLSRTPVLKIFSKANIFFKKKNLVWINKLTSPTGQLRRKKLREPARPVLSGGPPVKHYSSKFRDVDKKIFCIFYISGV
jgi:hypothetical protein